jgi:hypothetical protein
MTNEMTSSETITNANTNQANSQTNNGLTPTGATSVHGLTVLGEGLPQLKRAPTVRTVAIDAIEASLLASHASSMGLKAIHESAHACATCEVGALEWPGLASVFGSRANAAHLRVKSVDVTDRAGGHTHVAREFGRAFSTSQDLAAQVVIALAGIAAERLYSTPTDGGESDLRAATRLCSTICAMGADLHAVGSDGQPGSLMPSMDSIGDKATEVLKHEYIVRMRRILDDGMAEALRICRMRQAEIVGLANKVIEAGGRLSDQAVLDALKAVGMPVADTLTVDDRDE